MSRLTPFVSASCVGRFTVTKPGWIHVKSETGVRAGCSDRRVCLLVSVWLSVSGLGQLCTGSSLC